MKSAQRITGCVAGLIAGLMGCMNTSPRATAPWRVQRVPAAPAPMWRPFTPQPATPSRITPIPNNSPAPNNIPNNKSGRPGDKLVPTPTPDPQSKPKTTYSEEETVPSNKGAGSQPSNVKPEVRFKPAPQGSFDTDPGNSLPASPRGLNERAPVSPNDVKPPLLQGPKFGAEDKSASFPGTRAPISNLRFEALSAPNDSALKMRVVGQQKRPVGGTVTFDVLVQNDGKQTVDQIAILVDFDNSLVFPGHRERQLRKNIGQLLPGQSREMRLTLASNKLGSHECRFGLLADGKELQQQVASVEFIEPKLQLELLGPARRTVGSRAEFSIKVANVSDRPIDDLQLALTHDAALTPREATGGYKLERDRMTWSLGSLGPGEGRQVQAEFDCRQLSEQACVTVEAHSEELSVDAQERCVTVVAVPGELDLRVSDRQDPIKVGGEVLYEITVQNLGLKAVSTLQINVQSSEHLRLDSLDAFVSNKGNEKAASLAKQDRSGRWTLRLEVPLPPDATLRLSLRSKAVTPGDAELRVETSSGANGAQAETFEFTTVNE